MTGEVFKNLKDPQVLVNFLLFSVIFQYGIKVIFLACALFLRLIANCTIAQNFDFEKFLSLSYSKFA